jgi:hypothetical protein
MPAGTRAVWCCLALGACYPENIPTVDNDTWRWFPLDGELTWTYQSDDISLPYRLVAHKPDESEPFGDSLVRIHTITFTYDCLGVSAPCDVDADEDDVPDLEVETAFVWKVSADSSKGALFHAWSEQTFDPPVKIASPSMFINDTAVTESGGTTYTSLYREQGLCDAPYWRGAPPDDCITFQVDTTGSSTPLQGILQTIYQFGFTKFQLDGQSEAWRLVDFESDLG